MSERNSCFFCFFFFFGNIWKMKQQRNQSAQGNCSSQREWRDLHIQREAAGKELQRDYANPWLGERWLIARAGDALTALYLGNDYANYTPPARVQGNWLNEKICSYASVSVWCPALRQSHLAPGWSKHEQEPLSSLTQLHCIHPTSGWWDGKVLIKQKGVFGWPFSFYRESVIKGIGKWELKWEFLHVVHSFLILVKFHSGSKKECRCPVNGLCP